MIGSFRVASHARNRIQISGPDTARNIQSRMTRSGGDFDGPACGFVASIYAFDDIAFGLEIACKGKVLIPTEAATFNEMMSPLITR